jgi:hypothetical protein
MTSVNSYDSLEPTEKNSSISYSFVSKNSTLTSIHVHLPSNAQDRIYALEVKIATYWNAALPILEHIKSRTD